MRPFATVTEEDGVVARSADVNGTTLAELRFPPAYVQDDFEPERPYLAFVLDGRLQKSFRCRTIDLAASAAVTMPAGAAHGARFGSDGARIVIVKPSKHVAGCLDRLAELRGRGLDWLAWRLAAELRAADASAPLAGGTGSRAARRNEPRDKGRAEFGPGSGMAAQRRGAAP
jgi:hypothetical protein